MNTLLLLILVMVVPSVVLFTLALCRSSALADRKMENLRSGYFSDYDAEYNLIQSETPTVPVRGRLRA